MSNAETLALKTSSTTATIQALLDVDPVTPIDFESLKRRVDAIEWQQSENARNTTPVLSHGPTKFTGSGDWSVTSVWSYAELSRLDFYPVREAPQWSTPQRVAVPKPLSTGDFISEAIQVEASETAVLSGIPIHSALFTISIVTLAISAGSLGMWFLELPFVVNPFIAILMLIVVPFIFLMGRAAQRD